MTTPTYTVEALRLGAIAAGLDKPLDELANLGPDEVRTLGYMADVSGTGVDGAWYHWRAAVEVAAVIRWGTDRVAGARRLVGV